MAVYSSVYPLTIAYMLIIRQTELPLFIIKR